MTPTVVQFEPIHLMYVDCREGTSLQHKLLSLTAWHTYPGVGWTALIDGGVIGCAGMLQVKPDVGLLWAEFSREIEKFPVWLTRTVKLYIPKAMELLDVTELEVWPLECSKRNRDWADRLGFRQVEPVESKRDFMGRTYLRYASRPHDHCERPRACGVQGETIASAG